MTKLRRAGEGGAITPKFVCSTLVIRFNRRRNFAHALEIFSVRRGKCRVNDEPREGGAGFLGRVDVLHQDQSQQWDQSWQDGVPRKASDSGIVAGKSGS